MLNYLPQPQSWNHPEDDWDDPDLLWDQDHQQWIQPDLEPLYADPQWLDLDQDWLDSEEPDYYPAAMESNQLGFGFVISCSILICTLLAYILFKATAGTDYSLLMGAAPIPGTVASVGDRYAGEQPQPQADESAAEIICAVSDRFPPAILQWCGLITQYANRHGLPPDLIAALILQESGGNPVAYSRSGAVGLMQVMPQDGIAATFMCVNGPCFSSRPTTEQLKDPEFNIKYGTKMLAGLLNRNGNIREALRSYGPMNVGYYYADIVLGLFQRYGKSSS